MNDIVAIAADDRRFPADRRLRKRREFLRVQRGGQRVFGQRFIFHFKTGHAPHNRLGITVSRKVGNAVRRNRIKRLVREVFRQHPALHASRPDGTTVDIVVTAKKGVDDFRYATIKDEMLHVITRYLDNPASASRARRRRSVDRRR